MREKIRDFDHLRNILNFTEELLSLRSRFTLESLQKDKIFFYGVVKEVEMIGEASYQLTNEFRESHGEVPWRVMIDMRHVLVHGYYQVSPSKLWETIVNDLDELHPLIEKYIKELEEQ